MAFDLARHSCRSGPGGLAGDSGGSWGSTAASTHGYGDDEGGICSDRHLLMVIRKANDVCRKTMEQTIIGATQDRCNDSERDESTEEQLQYKRQSVCSPHGTLSPAMVMSQSLARAPSPC